MNSDEALVDILLEAKRITANLPRTVWYGFGSYFRRQDAFGDIDVLVVCSTPADAIVLRKNMNEICMRWPLHLLIMTEDEERETDFVASQECVLLQPCQKG